MMDIRVSQSTTLQVIVLALPLDARDQSVEFGLQDKAQRLHFGVPLPDATLCFHCVVTARLSTRSAAPDLAGSFVHGKSGARFLYLSLRRCGASDWIRRIKIPLESFTWEQINEASQPNHVLSVCVQGDRSGTVALLDAGWTSEGSQENPCLFKSV